MIHQQQRKQQHQVQDGITKSLDGNALILAGLEFDGLGQENSA